MLSKKEYLQDFPKVLFTNVGPGFVLLTYTPLAKILSANPKFSFSLKIWDKG